MATPTNPSRVDALRALAAQEPKNALVHYMLANELLKHREFQGCLDELETYLGMTDDEGSAYRVQATALLALDREEEAKAAYRRGIAAAQRHQHSSMVSEFEAALEDLG